MRAKLGIITDSVVLLLSVMMIGTMVTRWIPRQAAPPAPTVSSRTGYHRGERIGVLPGVDFSQTKRTLVLFIRTTCPYCVKSMPFYHALVEQVRSRGAKARLVIVGPEHESELRTFLASHDVSVDDVVSSPSAGSRIPGTPTLVLVDPKGIVLDQWVGVLPGEREGQVVHALESAPN
jgi:hypothetical protein